MVTSERLRIGKYEIALDRAYDSSSHLWVMRSPQSAEIVTLGLDPLGIDSCGDAVALSFVEVGTAVARGDELGFLEAAKFVGPLLAPVPGIVRRHNPKVLADPSRLNDDPFGSWLLELELAMDERSLPGLLRRRDELLAFFAREIERYEREGMLAE